MSSQSAKYRTTANAAVGTMPAQVEDVKVKDQSAERVSWLWLPALALGGWLLLAYIVPAVADWLALMLDPTL